jgi:homocitrate synthase NifV
MMGNYDRRIVFKDSTMREGLDVPGVTLDLARKRTLLEKLAELQVPEAELVAPGHFEADIAMLRDMAASDLPIVSSGLVYGNRPECGRHLSLAEGVLERVDILMPLAALRPPSDLVGKAVLLKEALRLAAGHLPDFGAGFPHALQVPPEFVVEMSMEAVSAGAGRITLYDTNGAADPWQVAEVVAAVRRVMDVEICFHAHNDLGMATANSLAAVRAGARCLDVTVNGLGDRAGNASMEQLAVALHNRQADHGLRLELLPSLSRWVAEVTGVPVPDLAPVVGRFVCCHKSPGHLQVPALFEAFDPELIGLERSICRS